MEILCAFLVLRITGISKRVLIVLSACDQIAMSQKIIMKYWFFYFASAYKRVGVTVVMSNERIFLC